MSDENIQNELTDSELTEVSGGGERFVPKPGGGFEYWYICGACGQHRELILSGPRGFNGYIEGTYVCPKCGWTRNYSLHV